MILEGQTETMFATPFFVGKIDYEYEIPDDPKWVEGNNRKGLYEGNVLPLELPDLEAQIIECCETVVKDVGFVGQPMKCNQVWLNIYDEKRPLLPVHYHQNCIWCGSFYPEDANHYVSFTNPNAGYQNMYFPEVVTPSDFNQDYMRVIAKKGTIIIHPSWISHSAHWMGGEPSYSISFDVGYRGAIGNKTYGSYNDGQ